MNQHGSIRVSLPAIRFFGRPARADEQEGEVNLCL
jgi:hypothetical protein